MNVISPLLRRETSLQDWRPACGASMAEVGGCILFTDLPGLDWHLLAFDDQSAAGERVRLSVTARPLPGCNTRLLINQWGKGDVASLDAAGVMEATWQCEDSIASSRPDGAITLEATWHNIPPRVCIGTSQGPASRYPGSGHPQWSIEAVHITVLPPSDRLVLVDVGGLGGLQPLWTPYSDRITPIVFEPNLPQANAIRPAIETYPGGKVIAEALANMPGRQTLNVARSLGCSSLRKPNPRVLDHYSIAPAFAVTHQLDVQCTRYDALHAAGVVPVPDVIKVDVQGFEHEVLSGFGALLDTCLGVELEAHFYSIYAGQYLFGDLVALLDGHGLTLRRISPVAHFDGDVVEVDAWFTVGPARLNKLGPAARSKLALLQQAWDLPPHSRQFSPQTWG